MMHLLKASLFAGLVSAASDAASHSFAGANNYFLHATSHAIQEQYISELASWGTKLVRLWGS